MKRLTTILSAAAAILVLGSCVREVINEPVAMNDEIVLSFSSMKTKAIVNSNETYINHADIIIFRCDDAGKPADWFHTERVVPNTGKVVLEAKRSDFTAGAKYYVQVVANSSAEASFFEGISYANLTNAKQVDENMLGVARMLGANELQAFFHVVIPSCVPYIFAGMQVGLSTCWMAVLAAEMVSSTEGIGWTITAGQENGDMTQIFVGIIAIAIVGLLLAVLMRWAERVLCSWRVRGK